MIAALSTIDLVQIVGVVGTAVAAVVAFRKAKPEAGKIEADTDLIRVTALIKVVDSLEDQLDRANKETERIKKVHDRELTEMRNLIKAEREAFDKQLREVRAECNRLQGRIEEMERMNKQKGVA